MKGLWAIMRTPGGSTREGRILRLATTQEPSTMSADADPSIEDKAVKVKFRLSTAARLAISAVSVVVSIWGAAWWTRGLLYEYAGQISGVSGKVDDLGTQVRDLKSATDARLAELRDSTYTLARASEVALRSAIENPGSRVIDPRDPSKVITVRSADRSGLGIDGR